MNWQFTENLWYAGSWTFVHSLWIGLLLTIAAALVMQATRRHSPAFRYRFLSSLLLLFVVAVGIVFIKEWNEYGQQTAGHTSDTAIAGSVSLLPSYRVSLDQFLTQYGEWIVITWFIIFILKTIKMMQDVRQVKRLKHTANAPVSPMWQHRFARLHQHLGINTSVQLLESLLVKVPVVIGHLKPVILVPAGIFTQLPPDEIEAVLLHELAHIRRQDYIVNFLQRITEMIFFFNPGLLWVSSLLRSERENCCDDIAITKTADKEQYVQALIRFREHTIHSSLYAMGFPGQTGTLVQRVKRIVYSKNRSLSAQEGIFATMSMAFCILFLMVQMSEPKTSTHTAMNAYHPAPHTPSAPVFITAALTLPEGNKQADSERRKAISKKTKSTPAAAQAQKPLPPTDAVTVVRPMENIYGKDEDSDQQRLIAAQHRKEADIARAEADKQRKLAEIQRQEAEVLRKQAEVLREEAARQRVQAEKQREEAERVRLDAEKQRKQAEINRQQAEKYRNQQNSI